MVLALILRRLLVVMLLVVALVVLRMSGLRRARLDGRELVKEVVGAWLYSVPRNI
jgi:hypothetical protein